MTDLKDLTIEQFADITASDAPAPGGGSISALAGTLSAALAEMVARLTVGKKNYEAVEAQMTAIAQKAEAIRRELVLEIQRDSSSFNEYMDALSLPKGTDEEKAFRREKMQQGLKSAVMVPLGVATRASEIFPLAAEVVSSGNSNAVTDGLVAVMMARTAVLGAVFNVKINLESIKDEEFTKKYGTAADELARAAVAYEQKILASKPLSGGLY